MQHHSPAGGTLAPARPIPAPRQPSMLAGVVDVWVSSGQRHVPAHRRVAGTATPDQRTLLTACGWHPRGGRLISRHAAVEQQALPCLSCFPPATT